MTSYKPLMVAHFRGGSPRLALLVHGKFGPDFIFSVTPAKEDQRKLANDPYAVDLMIKYYLFLGSNAGVENIRDMGSGFFGSRSQP